MGCISSKSGAAVRDQPAAPAQPAPFHKLSRTRTMEGAKPLGVFCADAEGLIRFANATMLEMTGHTSSTLLVRLAAVLLAGWLPGRPCALAGRAAFRVRSRAGSRSCRLPASPLLPQTPPHRARGHKVEWDAHLGRCRGRRRGARGLACSRSRQPDHFHTCPHLAFELLPITLPRLPPCPARPPPSSSRAACPIGSTSARRANMWRFCCP